MLTLRKLRPGRISVKPLGALALLLLSCSTSTAPKGLTCISDPVANGMWCYDTHTNKDSKLSYNETDLFVCRPPDHDKALIEFFIMMRGK